MFADGIHCGDDELADTIIYQIVRRDVHWSILAFGY